MGENVHKWLSTHWKTPVSCFLPLTYSFFKSKLTGIQQNSGPVSAHKRNGNTDNDSYIQTYKEPYVKAADSKDTTSC